MCAKNVKENDEELSRAEEENERQPQLLDAEFKMPQVLLHDAGLFTSDSLVFS